MREMRAEDVHLRIDYFHGASDEHLRTMGVDRALLPAPAEWHASFDEDVVRPLDQRRSFGLVWEADGRPAGFSAIDHIAFGQEAFMHLHVLDPHERRRGLGTAFVQLSVPVYFEVFGLHRLYCEPNALNVAPNRTLQRAGFRYLFTHETTPGPLNFPQAVTRWVIERHDAVSGTPAS